jgi:predicted amidophosphoribosyltransferase
MEKLSATKCKTCDRPLRADEACRNPICSWDDRQFQWNFAVAMRSGHLERAINAYKYEDKKDWAQVFARVLVGFLEEKPKTFTQFDLVVASPTYVSRAEGRQWDHTRRVIELAYTFCQGRWPFDIVEPPAIIKTRATQKMMQSSTWRERKRIAENDLRDALKVTVPKRISGKLILVYDDVFTDGFTLNEVARCLIEQGGARAVCGVTLARQPWKGP